MVEHHSNNIQNVILRELFNANESIKIAVAWFTNDLLFQPLLLKLIAGVKVDIILNKDDINTSSNGLDFQKFIDHGGKLLWNTSNKLLHDKFCIIDNRVVISGSYNWTNKAEYNDESISVFTNEETTTSFYLNLFNKLSSKYDKVDKTDNVKLGRFPEKQGPYFELKFYHSVKAVKNGKFEFLFANTEENGLYAMLDNETFLPKTEYMFGQIQEFNACCSTNVVWLSGETKWGLFDGDSLNYIIPPTFEKVQNDNKYIYQHFIVTRNRKLGLIDNEGKFLLSCEYDDMKYSGIDRIECVKREKYGLFNKNEGFLLNCEYDELRYPGRYSVECVKSGKYGMLYCARKEINIIPCKYDEIEKVYWHSEQDEYFKLRQNNRWVLCHNGEIVSYAEYDDISHIYWCGDILFEVVKDGKKGIIQKDCSIIYDCVLDRISRMNISADTESATLIQKGDKFGLIHCGKVILSPVYDAIEDNILVCRRNNIKGTPKDGILVLQQDGKYGIYNIKNKNHLKCEFASINELAKHIIEEPVSRTVSAVLLATISKEIESKYPQVKVHSTQNKRDLSTIMMQGFDYRAGIKDMVEDIEKYQERIERECRLGRDHDGRLKKESESIKNLLSKIKK